MSSPVIANWVFATISFSADGGSVAWCRPRSRAASGSPRAERLHARIEAVRRHLDAVLSSVIGCRFPAELLTIS